MGGLQARGLVCHEDEAIVLFSAVPFQYFTEGNVTGLSGEANLLHGLVNR